MTGFPGINASDLPRAMVRSERRHKLTADRAELGNQQDAGGFGQETLRLSNFLWRPWYAKLWWICAAVFWVLVCLTSSILPRSFALQPERLGLFVTMAFHPYTIVPVLGLPLLFKWRRQVVFPWDDVQTFEDDEMRVEGLYEGESIGFHRLGARSHLSDPADIRSPLNPVNPANRWWRERH